MARVVHDEKGMNIILLTFYFLMMVYNVPLPKQQASRIIKDKKTASNNESSRTSRCCKTKQGGPFRVSHESSDGHPARMPKAKKIHVNKSYNEQDGDVILSFRKGGPHRECCEATDPYYY